MATKLEKMKAVAEDLNEVLAMDPPIPVDGIKTTTDMREAILVEVDGQIYESDERNLKEETWRFLTSNLGIEPLEDPNVGDAIDPEDAIPERKPKQKPKTEKKAKQNALPKKDKPVDKGRHPARTGGPPHEEGKAGKEKDKYGFRRGSKNSQAIAMFVKGATMKEVKGVLGITFYSALKKIESNGFSVTKQKNGKIKVK